MTWVYVAVGAAIGSPLRYLLGHLFDDLLPWGTIAVNVVGSFLLGLFSGLALGGDAMALLGVGFCGALTTYSSFAVQTHDSLTRGGLRLGTANVLLTVVPVLLVTGLGFLLGAQA